MSRERGSEKPNESDPWPHEERPGCSRTLRSADLAAVLFASCAEMPIDPTLETAMVVPRIVQWYPSTLHSVFHLVEIYWRRRH